MNELFEEKLNQVAKSITEDPRWDIQNELMTQVYGLTLFGYAIGVGRIICFLDLEDIQEAVINKLTSLGIGPKYAEGLIQHGTELFGNEDQKSYQSQLIDIGHSYFSAENINELKESIFANTEALNQP